MADQIQDTGTEGAEIVKFLDAAKDVRFPVLNDLETYWHTLRGARLVPARADVDPRRIENALEYAFILERVAPGMARFRLAGMHLSDLMGMEVRGMPLSAFFAPDARKPLSDTLEKVFDDPAIVRVSLNAETGTGRPAIEARLLLLPLKSDFGDVSRALGCLVTIGPIGRAPRRFSISATDTASIIGPHHAGDHRIRGWSNGGSTRHKKPLEQQAAGFAEQKPSYKVTPKITATGHRERPTSPPPRADGKPRLYIVSSND